MSTQPSRVVQENIDALIERERAGRIEHGDDMDRADFPVEAWLAELISESLDSANYGRKLQHMLPKLVAAADLAEKLGYTWGDGSWGALEATARRMFEQQADPLAVPWERQWEPTKEHWRKKAAMGCTPVAPGIDLQWLVEGLDEIGSLSCNLRQGGCDAGDLEGLENGLMHAVDMAHQLRDRLLAMIDASPKGALPALPDDFSESKDWRAGGYAERVEWLLDTVRSQRGHIDALLDSPEGGSTDAGPKIWGTQKPGSMPKLFGARHIAGLNWYPGEGYDLVCMQVIERVQANSHGTGVSNV